MVNHQGNLNKHCYAGILDPVKIVLSYCRYGADLFRSNLLKAFSVVDVLMLGLFRSNLLKAFSAVFVLMLVCLGLTC